MTKLSKARFLDLADSEDDPTTQDDQLKVGDGVKIILPKGSKDYETITKVKVEIGNDPVASASRKKGAKKWTLKFRKGTSGADQKKAQAGIRDFHMTYVESVEEARAGAMTTKAPGVGKITEPTHMRALARRAGKSAKEALELWGKAQAAANKQGRHEGRAEGQALLQDRHRNLQEHAGAQQGGR